MTRVLLVPSGQQLGRILMPGAARGEHLRDTVGADPPESGPVIVVVVEQHDDARFRRDVGEAGEAWRAFRLVVDRRDDSVPLQCEDDGDEMGCPGSADGGEPRHPDSPGAFARIQSPVAHESPPSRAMASAGPHEPAS